MVKIGRYLGAGILALLTAGQAIAPGPEPGAKLIPGKFLGQQIVVIDFPPYEHLDSNDRISISDYRGPDERPSDRAGNELWNYARDLIKEGKQ
jgi:hypothetical protein